MRHTALYGPKAMQEGFKSLMAAMTVEELLEMRQRLVGKLKVNTAHLGNRQALDSVVCLLRDRGIAN